jgi:hypothetical protein
MRETISPERAVSRRIFSSTSAARITCGGRVSFGTMSSKARAALAYVPIADSG